MPDALGIGEIIENMRHQIEGLQAELATALTERDLARGEAAATRVDRDRAQMALSEYKAREQELSDLLANVLGDLRVLVHKVGNASTVHQAWERAQTRKHIHAI